MLVGPYLIKCAYKVVLQKLIPAQINQHIPDMGNNKRSFVEFVRQLTSAKRLDEHVLWNKSGGFERSKPPAGAASTISRNEFTERPHPNSVEWTHSSSVECVPRTETRRKRTDIKLTSPRPLIVCQLDHFQRWCQISTCALASQKSA